MASNDGINFEWVIHALKKRYLRIIIFFVAFSLVVLVFSMIKNVIISPKGVDENVKYTAEIFVVPELARVHDILNLNFGNIALYLADAAKEKKLTMEAVQKEMGTEDLPGKHLPVGMVVVFDEKTYRINAICKGRGDKFCRTYLRVYCERLNEYLANNTLALMDSFLKAGMPSSRIFQVVYNNTVILEKAIKDKTIQPVEYSITKKERPDQTLVPGIPYSRSPSFWFVMLLSCMYAAVASVLLIEYVTQSKVAGTMKTNK